MIDELQASLYILVHNVTLRFKIEEKKLDVKVKDGLHEIKTFTYTRFIMKSLTSFNIIVGSNNLYSHKQGGQTNLVLYISMCFSALHLNTHFHGMHINKRSQLNVKGHFKFLWFHFSYLSIINTCNFDIS